MLINVPLIVKRYQFFQKIYYIILIKYWISYSYSVIAYPIINLLRL